MYNDVDWLQTQYVDLQRSANDIAKECDVAPVTITYWLRAFHIPIRSQQLAVRMRKNHKSRKVVFELQSKKWLFDQYITLHKSTTIIAREHDCDPSIVLYWLHKLHIQVRRATTANNCNNDAIPLEIRIARFNRANELAQLGFREYAIRRALREELKTNGFRRNVIEKMAQCRLWIDADGVIHEY